MYSVIKTYGHSLGLSACFRQWRAKSHCAQLHGYALQIELVFASETLDENNWVIDFGSLKPVKQYLETTFDHRLLVAADDPEKDVLCSLAGLGLADVLVVDAVGCEAFARLIHTKVSHMLVTGELGEGVGSRVFLAGVSVREHAGNAATYCGDL